MKQLAIMELIRDAVGRVNPQLAGDRLQLWNENNREFISSQSALQQHLGALEEKYMYLKQINNPGHKIMNISVEEQQKQNTVSDTTSTESHAGQHGQLQNADKLTQSIASRILGLMQGFLWTCFKCDATRHLQPREQASRYAHTTFDKFSY